MPRGTLKAYLDFAPREEGFRDAVLAGLRRAPKSRKPCSASSGQVCTPR